MSSKHIVDILFTKHGGITPKNAIEYMGSAMELVENICKNTEGKTKLDTVISTLEQLAEKSDISDTEKHEITFIIQNIVPAAVDLIVRASRGLMELNKKIVKKCC